ncbi:site-specific DNA-methyltransferase, partial [Kaistia algarum]
YAKGERKNGRYEVVSPTGKKHLPGPDSHWLYSKSDTEKYIADNRIYFGKDGNAQPNVKRFLSEVQQGTKAKSIWFHKEVGSNDSAKRELKSIYGLDVPFDFPKPTTLITRLLHLFTSPKNGDLILDFFAGSGTTGHAVLNKNIEDNGNRKFILIQLGDEIGTNAKAKQQGFKKLSEIAIDRLHKVISAIDDKNGVGFRVLQIDSTNMKDVYYTPDAIKQADMLDLASNIKEDRTSEDLLFQVMLDWGLELSLPIERKTIAGKEVFFVAGNSLVACFEELTFDVVDEVAKDHPLRFVSAEKAIHLDHDKTNIKERFKQLSPDTEVKFL